MVSTQNSKRSTLQELVTTKRLKPLYYSVNEEANFRMRQAYCIGRSDGFREGRKRGLRMAAAVVTVIVLLAAVAIGTRAHAQTRLAPFGTTQMNRNLYVGQYGYPTIQAALSYGCNAGGSYLVIIAAGATPTDSPTTVTGCSAVSLVDQRTASPVSYGWYGSTYMQLSVFGLTPTGAIPSVGVNKAIATALGVTNSTAQANPNYLTGELNFDSGSRGAQYHALAPAGLADNTMLTDLRRGGSNVPGFFVNNAAPGKAALSFEYHNNYESPTTGPGTQHYGSYEAVYDYCCGKNITGNWRTSQLRSELMDAHAQGITGMDTATGFFLKSGDAHMRELIAYLAMAHYLGDDEGFAFDRLEGDEAPLLIATVATVYSASLVGTTATANGGNYGEGLNVISTRGAIATTVTNLGAPTTSVSNELGTMNLTTGVTRSASHFYTLGPSSLAAMPILPGNQTASFAVQMALASGVPLVPGPACISSPDEPMERANITSAQPYDSGSTLQTVQMSAHYRRVAWIHVFQGGLNCAYAAFNKDSSAGFQNIVGIPGADSTSQVYYVNNNDGRLLVPDTRFFIAGNATYNGITIYPNGTLIYGVTNPGTRNFDGTLTLGAADAGIFLAGDTIMVAHGSMNIVGRHVQYNVRNSAPLADATTNFVTWPNHFMGLGYRSSEPLTDFAPLGGPRQVDAQLNNYVNTPILFRFWSNLPPVGALDHIDGCWHTNCSDPTDIYPVATYQGHPTIPGSAAGSGVTIDAYHNIYRISAQDQPNSSNLDVTPFGAFSNNIISGKQVGFGGTSAGTDTGYLRYIGNGYLYGFMSTPTAGGSPLAIGFGDIYLPCYTGGDGGQIVGGDGGIGTVTSQITYRCNNVWSFDKVVAGAAPQQGTAQGQMASLVLGSTADTITTSATVPTGACTVKGFNLSEDKHIAFCSGSTWSTII